MIVCIILCIILLRPTLYILLIAEVKEFLTFRIRFVCSCKSKNLFLARLEIIHYFTYSLSFLKGMLETELR